MRRKNDVSTLRYARSFERLQLRTSVFKQAIIDHNKLIENVSSSVRSDFETVILETFPDVNAEYQSRVIEKSYKDKENIENTENITSFLENTMLKQHTEHTGHDKNDIAQYHFNNDSAKTCKQ